MAALSPKQLDDLAVWLEAGGSLCVVAPLARLDERPYGVPEPPREHAPWDPRPHSNAIPTARVGQAADAPGKPPPDRPSRFSSARRKLGRCVNSRSAPSCQRRRGHLPAAEWSRGQPVSGAFECSNNPPIRTWGRRPKPGCFRATEVGRQQCAIQQRLFQSLPRSTRMIPYKLVGPPRHLGVFILLAGPGEWFALGWLRRRRWTSGDFPSSSPLDPRIF